MIFEQPVKWVPHAHVPSLFRWLVLLSDKSIGDGRFSSCAAPRRSSAAPPTCLLRMFLLTWFPRMEVFVQPCSMWTSTWITSHDVSCCLWPTTDVACSSSFILCLQLFDLKLHFMLGPCFFHLFLLEFFRCFPMFFNILLCLCHHFAFFLISCLASSACLVDAVPLLPYSAI